IEIDHILIRHAEAARRYCFADRLRLVRAVNAVERRAEIDRAAAERIVGAALHEGGKSRLALAHLFRRRPVGPFALLRNLVHTRPAESVAADADAVADRAVFVLYIIK